MGVVITASPGPMPSVANATCRAAVQEFTAKAAGAFTAPANTRSKRFTFGPVVIQSDRRVSTTSAISSSPMHGGENGKKVFRILESLMGLSHCDGRAAMSAGTIAAGKG